MTTTSLSWERQNHKFEIPYGQYNRLNFFQKLFWIPKCATCGTKDPALNLHTEVSKLYGLYSKHENIPIHKAQRRKHFDCIVCLKYCNRCDRSHYPFTGHKSSHLFFFIKQIYKKIKRNS